jgi:hypothetical protein
MAKFIPSHEIIHKNPARLWKLVNVSANEQRCSALKTTGINTTIWYETYFDYVQRRQLAAVRT